MTAKVFFLALMLAPLPGAFAQSGGSSAKVKALYDAGRWEEVVEATRIPAERSSDLDYYRGMALARLNRWDDAKLAFESGRLKDPRDKRFPIELAGVAYKQGRNGDAKAFLRAALRLDPSDEYAADFLATLYLLDGNVEAAVQSWNKTGKPEIREIKVQPPLRTDPELIDRSFAAAPASVLRLEDFRITRARLNALGVFSAFRLDLNPSPAPNLRDYDLQLSASERNGWGDSRLGGLLSLVAGVPYQTAYPEFYNFRHSAINIRSLVRWDSKKRRAWLSISAPLGERPGWHTRFFADVRDEDWDITHTFHGPAGLSRQFSLRKAEAGGEVQGIFNSRLTWTGGVAASSRNFESTASSGTTAAPEFANTFVLEARSRADIALVRVPERRFTLDSSWTARLGNATAAGLGKYGAVEGGLASHWFPQPRSDDYEMEGSVRGGRLFGQPPFDELYILGLERDNDLPLRGHIGTAHGKKGSAPLGRGYWLSNWEINKNLITIGWIRLRLAPFLDSGRAYDSSFGSREWLWDTGGEMKILAPGGTTLVMTYGKDLRAGHNSFYITVEHNVR